MTALLELTAGKTKVDMKSAIDAFLNQGQSIMVARKGEEGFFAAHCFYPSMLETNYEIDLAVIAEYILDGEWFLIDELKEAS